MRFAQDNSLTPATTRDVNLLFTLAQLLLEMSVVGRRWPEHAQELLGLNRRSFRHSDLLVIWPIDRIIFCCRPVIVCVCASGTSSTVFPPCPLLARNRLAFCLFSFSLLCLLGVHTQVSFVVFPFLYYFGLFLFHGWPELIKLSYWPTAACNFARYGATRRELLLQPGLVQLVRERAPDDLRACHALLAARSSPLQRRLQGPARQHGVVHAELAEAEFAAIVILLTRAGSFAQHRILRRRRHAGRHRESREAHEAERP